MAINTVSSSKAADLHAQQQSSTSKPKSKGFAEAMASAAAAAPAPAPAAKQVNTSNTLQSGDGTKATA